MMNVQSNPRIAECFLEGAGAASEDAPYAGAGAARPRAAGGGAPCLIGLC